MATRLILTRHGETRSNIERRYTGHREDPLTTNGRRQARALARRLRDEPTTAAYASDLSRALETARIALGPRPIEVTLDPRLREISFGEWEGLTFEEVREGWPDDHHRLRGLGPGFQAPGGEHYGEIAGRIMDAIAEIVARHKDETVLVVTHGGALQVVLHSILRLPDDAFFRFGTNNCGITIVEYHGERVIVGRVNDTAHLERTRAKRAEWG